MITIVSFALALSLASADTFCTDAACCKANSKTTVSAQVCDDFYNPSVGVAYTMLTTGGWLRESVNIPYSIFHDNPSSERLGHEQQWSTSITHSGKRACPYPAASKYGVIMDISSRSNLWEYFQVCNKEGLCGQCHDGFKCSENQRTPIKGTSYADFRKEADPIIATTGTSACHPSHPTAYNEFNTNGLSSGSVRGLLIPQCLANNDLDTPASAIVCSALVRKGGPGRWPVYVYDNDGMATNGKHGNTSSLRIDSYMWCVLEDTGNVTATTEVIV
mmetsp:Transcript_14989/g.24495  ORF Transcript_14989/g.24495 Transcript_14989/m.24495 type:complete len:275 (+) Transcript_14989:60-884(+)